MSSYKVLEDKIDEGDEIEITEPNQLRNLRKKLDKKKKLVVKESCEDLINEIKRIECAINEFENINKVPIKPLKGDKKKIIENESRFLDAEIKRVKIIKEKMRIKEERIRKIRGSNNMLNPHWTVKKHVLFPEPIKDVVVLLMCLNNYEKTYFYYLPKDVVLKILENIRWDDHSKIKVIVHKKKRKRYLRKHSMLNNK